MIPGFIDLKKNKHKSQKISKEFKNKQNRPDYESPLGDEYTKNELKNKRKRLVRERLQHDLQNLKSSKISYNQLKHFITKFKGLSKDDISYNHF